MSVYFFEIADCNPPIPCCGHIMAGLEDVRKYALNYASLLLVDQGSEFWDGDEVVMTVTDETRLTLFTITLSSTPAPSTMNVGAASFR